MPYSDMLLPTLPDVARHCQTLADYRNSRWRPSKPEVVATILNSGKYPTSVSIGSVTDVSGIVENVGLAVEIGSQAQPVQCLFPFPVLVAAILIFGSGATSDYVGQCQQYGIQVGHGRKYGGRSWNCGAIYNR